MKTCAGNNLLKERGRMMDFEDLQKRRIRRAFIIGHIALACTFLSAGLIYIFWEIVWLRDTLMAVLFSLFPAAIAAYGGGAWLKHLAKQGSLSVTAEELEDSAMPLLESPRVMAMRETHWRYGIHFFTLKGKRIAYAEEINPANMLWITILRLFGLRIWMSMKFEFFVSETNRLILEKKAGLKPFYFIDNDGKIIAKFTYKWHELIMLKIHVKDPDGKDLALLNGGLQGDIIKLTGYDGEEWMQIKVGGVPLESMELFPNGGHIIDISHDLHVNKRLLAFASLIAIHSFYDLKE